MTQKIINMLKENDQDFEWYPTTDEILECIFNHLKENLTNNWREKYRDVLDIGAGNGKFYTKMKELADKTEAENDEIDSYNRGLDWNSSDKKQKSRYLSIQNYYVIEKSEILINQMPQEAIFTGADFHDNSLIDKPVDIIFCNPPYSEFIDWTVKIIKQGNAKKAFLVIPERWENNREIEQALKARKASYKIIGSFDFLNAERQARAKIDVIEVSYYETVESKNGYDEKITTEKTVDPFELFCEEIFGIKEPQDTEKTKESEETRETIQNELVAGRNLIEVLLELHDRDFKKLSETYQKIYSLDFILLKELEVKIVDVQKSLKLRISGLRSFYWQELFDKLDKITDRLTSSSRQSMLSKLHSRTNIDFNTKNCYGVVIWVIRHANSYFTQQMLEMFETLTTQENIRNYKSNQKTWENDNWRYKNKHTHYTLDYRLIIHRLYDTGTIINDLNTIANNLGFCCNQRDFERNISQDGCTKYVYFHDGQVFYTYKYFKNGNLHLKMNKEFMKAFNIEVSRLKKWVCKPEDIINEFDDSLEITQGDVTQYFNSSYVISGVNNVLLLK